MEDAEASELLATRAHACIEAQLRALPDGPARQAFVQFRDSYLHRSVILSVHEMFDAEFPPDEDQLEARRVFQAALVRDGISPLSLSEVRERNRGGMRSAASESKGCLLLLAPTLLSALAGVLARVF